MHAERMHRRARCMRPRIVGERGACGTHALEFEVHGERMPLVSKGHAERMHRCIGERGACGTDAFCDVTKRLHEPVLLDSTPLVFRLHEPSRHPFRMHLALLCIYACAPHAFRVHEPVSCTDYTSLCHVVEETQRRLYFRMCVHIHECLSTALVSYMYFRMFAYIHVCLYMYVCINIHIHV